jgi:hypothetical protein
MPESIDWPPPRVSAEESEVVAIASGIMFWRAIGLPENMLRTASRLE